MTAAPQRVLDQSLRIELCREVDVAPLMRFIGTQWRARHILSHDEPLLRWQFAPELLRGRDAPGPTVLLALLGGEIVGMLGLTGFDLNLTGVRSPAAWLSHWFVALAYRGFNVALRLILAARDLGIAALVTLGSNEVSTKVLERLGFEVIPSLPRWVGVFDAAAAAELVCGANPKVSFEDALRSCRGYLVEPKGAGVPQGGLQPGGWSPVAAAEWDRLWNERLAKHLVGASRDAAYLRWRYVEHPRFEYEVRFAQRDTDGAVEGMAAFRVEQVRDRATRVLRIVEFLGSAAGEATLVRAIIEAARDSGAAIADFYCSSARTAQAFERAGFKREIADSPGVALPSRFQPLEAEHLPITVLARLPPPWGGTLRELVEDGRLYITKSDGDQDRPN